jgi:hypothetical protein
MPFEEGCGVLIFLCDNLGAAASSWHKRLLWPSELWELDLAHKGRFHHEEESDETNAIGGSTRGFCDGLLR